MNGNSNIGLLEVLGRYQIIHVICRTLNAAVASHGVQRESLRPGAVGNAQLELKTKRERQRKLHSLIDY